MAKKEEFIAGAANPNRGMPTEMRVAEIGSNSRKVYQVVTGNTNKMIIPQEITDKEIKTYPGGTTSATIKEGEEKGE